jgi:DNA polymerase-3 subunit beta
VKIVIKQKALAEVMNHVSSVVEKRQVVPVLGCILVEAKKEIGVTMTATNMDMTMINTINCEVIMAGACCIGAHLFSDLIKKIPEDQTVTIEKSDDEDVIKIAFGRSSFSLNYIKPSEFPPSPERDDDVISLDIDTDLFRDAIDVARTAMVQDGTRFYLRGVHIHHDDSLEPSKLSFVATDLYRIARADIDVQTDVSNFPKSTISKKAVTEVLKLAADTDAEKLHIEVSSSRICIEFFGSITKTIFRANLVEGNFPNYKEALGVSNDRVLTINTKTFLSAVDRVRTVVSDITSTVKISLQKDKITISGSSKQYGKAMEEIAASFDSLDPMEIFFNGKFLLDLVGQVGTEEVKFFLAESNSSAIITPAYTEVPSLLYTCAIMPIQYLESS